MLNVPCATYRVQFNRDFRFEQARALLPYLKKLGISHLYASPIFQARPGSAHGYDVTNPCVLNPELGTSEDFDALARELRENGMQLILDIVPNHMAATPANPWWMDVLENGSASEYSAYFDVEWGEDTPSVEKIVLPVLGEPYGAALESQKLRLILTEHGFRVSYYQTDFPLDPATYQAILTLDLPELLQHESAADPGLQEYGRLLEIADRLPARSATEWEAVEFRRREAPDFKKKLWAAYQGFPRVRAFLDSNLKRLNGEPGHEESFDLLDQLLNQQPYQLTFWRAARERINYRRFFDVSELIGIRVQDPQVFEATHRQTLKLMEDGKVAGLRIDHVDGLYNPLEYLVRLQGHLPLNAAGSPPYVVVEKILCDDESLPYEWPVAGTTGYDFLGMANNVFVDPQGLRELAASYAHFTGFESTFHDAAYVQKKKIMDDLFAGEIRALALHLNLIAERYRHARDLSPEELRDALVEVTACLPVYRSYSREGHVGARDRAHIQRALSDAARRNPAISAASFSFLQKLLLLELDKADKDALRFVMRWQQLTGPIMAKGVEDTTLYLYHPLASMNDVGGRPEPVSVEEFHKFNYCRQQHWSATMNASSTHDTKRSEDVRARINVLSEMPGEWQRRVNRWHNWARLNGLPAIDPNDEQLLYQTLLGTWPLDGRVADEFRDRIRSYMLKAAREAKAHTSWTNANQEYEQKLQAFVDAVLTDAASNRFLAEFLRFEPRAAFYGAINSLSQTLLKTVCPGAPDFYQGTTFWDFSLVDPDNRRPVNITDHLAAAKHFEVWRDDLSAEAVSDLLENWRDGRVKAFVIYKALRLRCGDAELFSSGDYMGLSGTILAETHALAFARRFQERWLVCVTPRFLTKLSAREKMPLGRRLWGESSITLPEGGPGRWRNLFTGERIAAVPAPGPRLQLALADILKSFPVALLANET
jgi:(1->4)-alpha-D-glucan 1-alpha-D-glucosylmutase